MEAEIEECNFLFHVLSTICSIPYAIPCLIYKYFVITLCKLRSSHSKVLYKKVFLKTFFCKFFEKLKNVFSTEHLWTWTHNWLTTLLSMFLFDTYLFICLNVSIYILIIYKWSKITAWFAFWLNINEIPSPKYVRQLAA